MDHADIFDRSTKNRDGISGVRIGIVTDNEDPKDLGRVKLRFPWREADDESYWARIATEMSGKQYGSYFLPEINDEVLVAFAGGDVHQPFVIGSLWNGNRKPPQKNSDGNNDIREIVSRQGHRVQFDDGDDGGQLTIETKAGHTITLNDADGKEKVEIADKSGKNRIRLDSSSDTVSIEAADTLELGAKTIKLRGDKTVDIGAKQSLDLSSKSKASLTSKGKLDINSTMAMAIEAGAILNIKGKMIFLN
ncbi:phage baseplate assembly protein V [Halohasta litorea]|uniref:Phage baseplate assembly protein V n=1 Tax=Halohasta litorea TaxID=869891 RepID=A0ABD6D945_9EURY|nr:phage baseplate assembly protein V [Halohasta litorea]